jgi:hypothetical protein
MEIWVPKREHLMGQDQLLQLQLLQPISMLSHAHPSDEPLEISIHSAIIRVTPSTKNFVLCLGLLGREI